MGPAVVVLLLGVVVLLLLLLPLLRDGAKVAGGVRAVQDEGRPAGGAGRGAPRGGGPRRATQRGGGHRAGEGGVWVWQVHAGPRVAATASSRGANKVGGASRNGAREHQWWDGDGEGGEPTQRSVAQQKPAKGGTHCFWTSV